MCAAACQKEIDAALLKLELTAAESERAKLATQTVHELRESVRHKDDVITEKDASIQLLQKHVKVFVRMCVCACHVIWACRLRTLFEDRIAVLFFVVLVSCPT